jgi:hypothetical protein
MDRHGAAVLSLRQCDRRHREKGIAMPRTRLSGIEQVALTYLAEGRSVVPIAPGCKAPSIAPSIVDARTGRPVLIRWERYQDAPATPDEVRR